MSLDIVNEKSTAYLTVTFKDKTGAEAIPNAVSYRIDCLTNDKEIRDDTDLTPGSSIEITLTPTDNVIIDDGNKTEQRIVTVTAVYGEDDESNGDFRYLVNNLKKKES